eukprot:UN01943
MFKICRPMLNVYKELNAERCIQMYLDASKAADETGKFKDGVYGFLEKAFDLYTESLESEESKRQIISNITGT